MEVPGIVLLALLLTAGIATFAAASLAGGLIASVVERRHRAGLAGWCLVAALGTVVGPGVLVGLVLLGDLLDGVPLLHPTWVACALFGAAGRVVVGRHLARPRR